MKTKHTTGEWNAKDSEVYSLITGNTIARCDIGGKDETTEANAKLIAAAPELLEALQNFVESIDLIVEGQKIGDIPDTEKYSAYSRIQKSMTYIKATEAIKKATE